MTAEPALRVLVVENDPGAVRLLQEILMSGRNENRVVMRTIEFGAPFLRKPFSATDLACLVREVLDS